MQKVTEIIARSVLNKSKIHDYCLNPYTGCRVRCRYCYAALFMRRYSGHKEAWGEFVDVKVNAPELLAKQLAKAKPGVVWVSSVCDPYQPPERKYRLTRKCLQVLAGKAFPVNIQTKSALVLRDLEILKQIEALEVGFTITTDDEAVSRYFEPGASRISERLAALETLKAAGIRTFAFIGPLLPGNPEHLASRLSHLADHVYIDRMNYLGFVKKDYRQAGLEYEMTEGFFQQQKERLAAALTDRNMDFTVLF